MTEEIDSQVIVCNIYWDKNEKRSGKGKKVELPAQVNINIPDNVLAQAKKTDFNDVIEQFICNLLYRKYGHEVNDCQIYLVGI